MALENPEEMNRHFKVEGELALEHVRKALEAGKQFDQMSQPLLAKALREQAYRNRVVRVVAEELARLLALDHLKDGEYCHTCDKCQAVCDTCQALKIWRGLLK